MIERRDGRDAAELRIAGSINAARLAVGSNVARVNLAIVPDRHLGCELVDIAGAANLVERVLEAEAGLGRDEMGDLLASLQQDFGRSRQDLAPIESGQLRSVCAADTEGLGDLGGASCS